MAIHLPSAPATAHSYCPPQTCRVVQPCTNTPSALEQAESEVITLAVTQAQQKVGPLAGVAQISPAFKDAREIVLKMARSEALAPLYKAMQALELQADDATVARQQLEHHWHATRTAAGVYEAILQSMRK